MARNKIALVGAGNIGGTLALLAGLKNLGDVTLIDIVKGVPQGKGLDLAQASTIEGFDAKIRGSQNYAALRGADVVIVTAGVARRPGMSRDDLLGINMSVMKAVGAGIKKYCPKTFVICITNPLDAMVHGCCAMPAAFAASNRVVGMAGVLDSARFRLFPGRGIQRLGRGRDCIRPRRPWRHHGAAWCAIRPLPASRCPTWSRWAGSTKESTRRRSSSGPVTAAPRSSACSKTGSAFYAPASSAIQMAESYLNRREARAALRGPSERCSMGCAQSLCRRARGDRCRRASNGWSRSR